MKNLFREAIDVPTLNRMTKEELEALNRLLGGEATKEDRKLLESSIKTV